MSGEATQADLNEASEIIMEGKDDSNNVGSEDNNSLFEEVVPDIQDPRDVEDGSVTTVKDTDDIDDAAKKLLDDVDPGKEVKPDVNAVEPDEITKLTEHKSNLEKALNESRAKNKSLQFRIDQQQNQPAPKVDDALTKVDPDFKVLNKDEFEELKGESAVDALQYMHDLAEYKDALAENAKVEAQAAQVRETTDSLIANSIEAISLAVPGVYDNEVIGQKLTEFAIEKGFDNDSLALLSNPATMVLDPDSNSPVPLGKTAVDFVKFCNSTMAGSNDTDLRAELTEEITATVTKDLLSKFKNNPGGMSLDEVAAAGSGSPLAFIAKSEDELRKMSSQEREDYYQGK